VRITTSVLAGLALIAPAGAAQPAAAPIRVVVAADGTGDFKTIQRAVDHALDRAPILGPTQRLIVEIRPGTYRERVRVPPDRPRVTFLGQDAASTAITYNMSAAAAGGTFFSAAIDVSGAEFEAANITFENSFGVGSQAVAISVHSDRAVFRNCRFLGWQDTLYAASGRQYYKDCSIEGHVDFIFGNSATVFDHCEIRSRGAGYIAAVSRTTPDMPTGLVFRECKLTGENTGKGVFLGRPWRPYARVVFLDCWMGDHIRPEGWDNWGNPGNEKTAWFGERGSAGPGAEAAKRVSWARPLSAAEAAAFAPEIFLRGADGWNPANR
jgi:pectinesterase